LATLITSAIIAAVYLLYGRTDIYQIRKILATNPEENIFARWRTIEIGEQAGHIDFDPLIALIHLDRIPELRRAAERPDKPEQKCTRLMLLEGALFSAGRTNEAAPVLEERENTIKQIDAAKRADTRLEIAQIYYETGRTELAKKSLTEWVDSASTSKLDGSVLSDGAKLAQKLDDRESVNKLLMRAEEAAVNDTDKRTSAYALMSIAQA
jgi:tetratricopeptide (TPR) repeat protein